MTFHCNICVGPKYRSFATSNDAFEHKYNLNEGFLVQQRTCVKGLRSFKVAFATSTRPVNNIERGARHCAYETRSTDELSVRRLECNVSSCDDETDHQRGAAIAATAIVVVVVIVVVQVGVPTLDVVFGCRLWSVAIQNVVRTGNRTI
jgi:hypothetical protein